MDVDEDEGTQQTKRVPDYGIEVDFSSLDEEELEVSRLLLTCQSLAQAFTQGGVEAIAELDAKIAKINANIEHMAPNMKAVEK